MQAAPGLLYPKRLPQSSEVICPLLFTLPVSCLFTERSRAWGQPRVSSHSPSSTGTSLSHMATYAQGLSLLDYENVELLGPSCKPWLVQTIAQAYWLGTLPNHTHYLTSASHKQAHTSYLHKLLGPFYTHRIPSQNIHTVHEVAKSWKWLSIHTLCLLTDQPHEQQSWEHLEIWSHSAHFIPSSSFLSSSVFEMKHRKMKDNRTSDNKWSEWPLVYSDGSKKGTMEMKMKWSSEEWGRVLGLFASSSASSSLCPYPPTPVRSVTTPQRSCAAEPQRQRWEAMPPRGQASEKAGWAQHVWALPAPAWPMMKYRNTPRSTGSQRVGRAWRTEQLLLVTHYVSNVLTVSCRVFETTSWGGYSSFHPHL